jgi:transcriptional regulator GlxA family with amidase domain
MFLHPAHSQYHIDSLTIQDNQTSLVYSSHKAERNAQNNMSGDYIPSWSANLVRCVGVCNGQLMLLSIGLADEVMSST